MRNRPIILGAHFPGVNNATVWSDPSSGSQIDFASFRHFVQTAERGKLDFFFLAEGLRLREQRGKLHDLDVVGRPNTLVALAALSAVTSRIGLVGTLNATFNEPYSLARELASLDALSGGRAGWNVVTSPGPFTGANFRRGGFLAHEQRYERAMEFVEVATRLWAARGKPVDHAGPQFTLRGRYALPESPQRKPVIFQAGDSAAGREFAARDADAVFTRHGTLEEGKAFYADVKARLARYGRVEDDLKILPGVGFVLGDTEEAAAFNHAVVRRQQVSPQTALVLLEQVWNRDLSAYDPDGPLPEIDPDVSAQAVALGRVQHQKSPLETANAWRELARRKRLSIRELVIHVTDRQQFVGTPASIAAKMQHFVNERAADGFILVPHLVPDGLDPFVDKVVPLLQERGVFRSEYAGTTLREHFGLVDER